MAEGARLESVFRGNSNVGSNPTLSAIQLAAQRITLSFRCNSYTLAFLCATRLLHTPFVSQSPSPTYGAKYPEISRIRCVGFDANALTEPLVVGTMAMFDVIAPSMAFSVDTKG